MRKRYVAMAVTTGLIGLGGATAVASAAPYQPTVSVGGAVASPATYTRSALAAMPQTTFDVTVPTRGGTRTVVYEGVSLETLVDTSAPELPDVKNALLTAIITVRGLFGTQRTFALGELDPMFGNHPAYLALEQGGWPLPAPELVVPGDSNDARSVPAVSRIGVAIENPAVTPPAEVGALDVEDGGYTAVLSPSELASLPEQTLTVSYIGPFGVSTHTETGPTLDEVLGAAHIRPDFNTWVAGVGSDDYVAIVTPAEAWVGGRPLLISLAQDGTTFLSEGEGPRLVTDGDVYGGRYDSGMDDLVVGDTQPGPWWW
jgi:hypothetical protein